MSKGAGRRSGRDEAGWERRLNTLQRRAVFAGKVARRPATALQPCRYLFILSHMRSRSSLLSHLLGSHPEISGHLETHIRYRRRRDFQKLRFAVSEAHGGAPLGRWVVDKLLHHWYADLELLDRRGVVPILLVREPARSIASLRHCVHEHTFERAVQHYEQQLGWLEQVATRFGDRALFVRSEDLLDRTGAALSFLGDALALSSPLREDYEIFERTGEVYGGDYSPVIRTGRVVRDDRKGAKAKIPSELLERARLANARCVSALEARCRHARAGALSAPRAGLPAPRALT